MHGVCGSSDAREVEIKLQDIPIVRPHGIVESVAVEETMAEDRNESLISRHEAAIYADDLGLA